MENPNKYKSSLTLGRASMASSLESSETCVCRSEIDVGSIPIASTLHTDTPVLATGLLSTTPGSGPGQTYREMLCELIDKYNVVAHDISTIDEIIRRLSAELGDDTGEITVIVAAIGEIHKTLSSVEESFAVVTARLNKLDENGETLSTLYETLRLQLDRAISKIGEVETGFSDMAEELDSMHVTIDTTRDSVNGLENVYGELQNDMGNVQTDVANLQNSVSNAQRFIEEVRDEVERIEANSVKPDEIKSIKDNLNGLELVYVEVLADNSAIHAQISGLEVSFSLLTNTITEISHRVDIIEQGTAGEIGKQIEELKKSIASANDSINGLTNVYESLDSRVTSNEQAISAANSLLAVVQKDIADIKKALDDGSGCICDMEAIKKDIVGIHDSLNGLSNVYETLSADVNVNTEAIGALQKANESIRHSLDALDKRIEDVAEAAGSKSEFLAEINAIKDNINGIENVIDAMKAVDVSAEARLDTAENAIRLLQEEIKDIIDHGVDHELLEQIQEEQVEQRKKMDQISGDNAYLEATWLQMLTDHGIKGDDMKLITMSEYRAIRPKLMKYYFVTTDENPKQLYRLYLFNKPIFEFDVRGNISVAFPKVFPTLLV